MIRIPATLRPYGPLILRVILGIIFLLHGLAKFGVGGQGGIGGTVQGFTAMGMPAPGTLAPLVALIETLGGIALILGVGTPIAALLLAAVMLGAILIVKFPGQPNPIQPFFNGAGWELDLALLGGLLALLFQGPGALSVDERRTPATA